MRRALIALPAVAILAILALVIWPLPLHIGDWFQFWFVGHILASGASPVDASSWRDAWTTYPLYPNDFVINPLAERRDVFETPSTFGLYPPWYAVLFLPFGILPLEPGITLLHITLIAVGLGGFAWLVSRWNAPAPTTALGLAMAVCLEPFVLASRTGHFTSFLFAGALMVLAALETGTTLPLVIGAVLLSTKPHLSILFALIVLGMLVRRRAWRPIATTTAVLLAVAVAFYIRYPPPVGLAARAVLVQATTDDTATTWSLAESLVPGYGLVLGTLAILVAASLSISAVRVAPSRYRTLTAVSLALALSIATAPYVHTYDQMLLVPALLLPLALSTPLPGPRRLAIGAATIVGVLVYPWLAYFADVNGRQAPTGAVPFIAIALVTVSVVAARWVPQYAPALPSGGMAAEPHP